MRDCYYKYRLIIIVYIYLNYTNDIIVFSLFSHDYTIKKKFIFKQNIVQINIIVTSIDYIYLLD